MPPLCKLVRRLRIAGAFGGGSHTIRLERELWRVATRLLRFMPALPLVAACRVGRLGHSPPDRGCAVFFVHWFRRR